MAVSAIYVTAPPPVLERTMSVVTALVKATLASTWRIVCLGIHIFGLATPKQVLLEQPLPSHDSFSQWASPFWSTRIRMLTLVAKVCKVPRRDQGRGNMVRKRYTPERNDYSQFRPHGSLGYQPSAPEAIQPELMTAIPT